jgi:hypothetical protein
MLVTGDALNYNMLDYTNAENFTFEVDPGTGSPYESESLLVSAVRSFKGVIRLPQLLKGGYGFGNLDATSTNDIGKDGVYDDAIVDWGFRGRYRITGDIASFSFVPFQVMPTVSVAYYGTPKSILP